MFRGSTKCLSRLGINDRPGAGDESDSDFTGHKSLIGGDASLCDELVPVRRAGLQNGSADEGAVDPQVQVGSTGPGDTEFVTVDVGHRRVFRRVVGDVDVAACVQPGLADGSAADGCCQRRSGRWWRRITGRRSITCCRREREQEGLDLKVVCVGMDIAERVVDKVDVHTVGC